MCVSVLCVWFVVVTAIYWRTLMMFGQMHDTQDLPCHFGVLWRKNIRDMLLEWPAMAAVVKANNRTATLVDYVQVKVKCGPERHITTNTYLAS